MGFFSSLKRSFLEIFSDEIDPLVCPHCGLHIVSQPIKKKCCRCGSINTVAWVDKLPVCTVCGNHSFERFCPRCGKSLDD